MLFRTALLAWTVGVGSAGCGGTSESTLDKRVDKLVRVHNQTAGIWCECALEYGWADRVEACEDATGYILLMHSECLHQAFAADELAALDFVACKLEAILEYRPCVDAELVCDPANPPQACMDQYLERAALCDPPPTKVGLALEQCANVHVGVPPMGPF